MEQVISKDGTRISVDRDGNGPALILVDGAMCSRGFGPMPPLAKALATGADITPAEGLAAAALEPRGGAAALLRY